MRAVAGDTAVDDEDAEDDDDEAAAPAPVGVFAGDLSSEASIITRRIMR